MQVDNLPSGGLLLQNDCAAIQESGTIVEMEGRNRYCSYHLKLKVSRLNIDVRRMCAARPNSVKYLLEEPLEFIASLGATGKLSRIENCRVVGKCGAKAVPIQIVECLDEIRKGLPDLCFGILSGGCRAVNACQRER